LGPGKGPKRQKATFTVFADPSPQGIYMGAAIIIKQRKRTVSNGMTEKDEDCSWEEVYKSCGCDTRYD